MKFSRFTTRFLRRDSLFGWLAFALLFCAPTINSAAPGDLDSTFGADGIAVTNIRTGDKAEKICGNL